MGVGRGENEDSESLERVFDRHGLAVRRCCERPLGESEAGCCWVARASGGTEALRRGEAATVAVVVCVADVMGAEFLPGADACTVCGTECSWTDPRLKSLLVCVLLAIFVVLRVRTSVGGEEKRSLWSTGADLRFIYDTGHMTVSIPSHDGIISTHRCRTST